MPTKARIKHVFWLLLFGITLFIFRPVKRIGGQFKQFSTHPTPSINVESTRLLLTEPNTVIATVQPTSARVLEENAVATPKVYTTVPGTEIEVARTSTLSEPTKVFTATLIPLLQTPDAVLSESPNESVVLPTPRGNFSWTLKVPILMYHYISIPPVDADIYRYDLSVEPGDFRNQMEYLSTNGYTTIDFYDLSLAIANKMELPEKPIIITLDDGYRDNYENAFPILQEFNLRATFFVATDFVDQGYETYMSWPMLTEMAAAGMRIEPHSKSHADLSDRGSEFLIWQILGSQETIAAHIGYTPRYFAYPSGRYDDNTISTLINFDFWGAVTTATGNWHGYLGRFEWTRLRIRHSTSVNEFIRLVDLDGTIGGKHPNEQ